MFDPTVFENLKVAFENQLYDLDNLSGRIKIINRTDQLVMSNMSREFTLQFELADQSKVTGEIHLQASLEDLAVEILEIPGETPGCTLTLRFYLQVEDAQEQCPQVEEVLQAIWKQEHRPTQIISFVYGEEPAVYTDIVEMKFHRKVNEDQMGDIPDLIQHVLKTITELGSI
ncbi:hypothetical protein SD71_00770 [Cohnella kolymensis]|uniref:Group-specific protein n=1 Tax=Cohnella kolymensis TaxID=1590652 RepID=A0ABR5A8F5_9BACL|nr:hypothetical protein [Cohnella kolymensis]KIL37277.1 hypothetical protein SD71_00770 [Cohnella kolymensis]